MFFQNLTRDLTFLLRMIFPLALRIKFYPKFTYLEKIIICFYKYQDRGVLGFWGFGVFVDFLGVVGATGVSLGSLWVPVMI